MPVLQVMLEVEQEESKEKEKQKKIKKEEEKLRKWEKKLKEYLFGKDGESLVSHTCHSCMMPDFNKLRQLIDCNSTGL